MLWETDAFAVAEEYDEVSESYRGLVLPNDGVELVVRDSTLLAVRRGQLRLDISATAADGFAEDKVRTVSENARNLRLEQSGFEND